MEKLIILSFLLVATITVKAQQTDFPKLTGPYLGQKVPGERPEIFAPGIVSTGSNASSPVVSPDGKEIYWDHDKIWFTRLENGNWTKPMLVSFCKDDKYLYRVPCFSPDGKKLFFLSTRLGAVSSDKENIWYVERVASGWSDPIPLSSNVNSLIIHWSISVSGTGTVYFQGRRSDTDDKGGIYYSKLVNDEYSEPVKMGPEINNPGGSTTCPYVVPDESYIIYNMFFKDNMEKSGIFISFKDKNKKWLPALRLLGGNPKTGGVSPIITPDGKFLFFANGNIFWMPVEKLIEELRPKL